MRPFSIGESLRFGWNKVREHFWFVVGTTFVYGILNATMRFGGGDEGGSPSPAFQGLSGGQIAAIVAFAVVMGIAFAVVSTIVQIGYTRIMLRLHDGERPKFKTLFTDFKPFWRYVGASLLYFLRVLAGIILLIVPGIIWALRYQFAPMIVVDRGLRAGEAMRESARLTEGYKWDLFKFGLAAAVVNILGVMALGVGLLVSIPVTTLAYIRIYRSLSEPVAEEVPIAPGEPQTDTTITA